MDSSNREPTNTPEKKRPRTSMSSGNQAEAKSSDSKSGVTKECGDKANLNFSLNFLNTKPKKQTFPEVPEEQPPTEDMAFELGESHLRWIRDEQGDVDLEVSPYPVNDPIKAKVLIINIERYFEVKSKGIEGHSRTGSRHDVEQLCLAFYKLGIKREEISVKGPNITREQLIYTVNTCASNESNKNLDVFIMAIFGHGGKKPQGEEYILTSKYEKVELRKEIVSMFNGQNAPSLLHKPKLFFVETCRGDKEDRGKKSQVSIKEMCSSPPPQPFLPVETDIFIARPSAPDHKSYQGGSNGSFFIQFLANRLYHEAAVKNLELHRIMIGVANDVAKVELDPIGAKGEKSEDKSLKQALWCTTSLRRPFYFKILE